MQTRALLLVDHVNAGFHENFGIEDVLSEWIVAIAKRCGNARLIEVFVRAYGGWWRGSYLSLERTEAAGYYQDAIPSRVAANGVIARISFQFSDFLLMDAMRVARIENTVAVRRKPARLRKRIGAKKCSARDCQLGGILAWVKSEVACTKSGCTMGFADAFERLEQKQVDTHLSVDLLCAVQSDQFGEIGVVSSDTDVVPALLAGGILSKSCGITLLRVGRFNTAMDPQIRRVGVHIQELRA